MTKPVGCLAGIVGLLVVSLVGGIIGFYGGKFFDRYERPWAYSETEPLLIGRWQGKFKDPDGIVKELTVNIDLPITDDERWGKAFRKRKRRSSSSKRSFDGLGTVTSKLGREDYDINGSVDTDDYHLFSLDSTSADDKYHVVPNFYVNAIKQGRWQTNSMTLTLRFSYHKKDRSSYWSSADPRFNQHVTATLQRVTP